MPRKANAAALRQMAAIREMQCTSAESKAVRASAAVQAMNAAANESERNRASAERSWRETVDAPSLSLAAAQCWSAQLRRDEAASQHANHDLEIAKQGLARRSAEWHAAMLRRDVADDAARQAQKQELRRRDESVLQDALDLHVSRRRSR
jgi:hypothetical protein